MQIREEKLGEILKHARWIEWQASQIYQAHDLGHGPGRHTDFDNPEFHLQARDVYKSTLPPQCLRLVSESFENCADLMIAIQTDDAISPNWDIVISYLRLAPGKTEDFSSESSSTNLLEPYDISDLTLGLLHYEELANLMHPELVEKLHKAATTVIRYCQSDSSFIPDDFQLACLQRLAEGEYQEELANHMGYSKRQIQRVLADIWNHLGVDDATQGLAIAVEQGWVAIPSDTDQ